MKTQSICLGRISGLPIEAKDWQIRVPAMVINLRQLAAIMTGFMVALVLVIMSVWVTELGITRFAASAGWGVAMLFLAAAADNHRGTAILQLLMAVTLAFLAWAQYFVAAEWGIVSALLLAPWLMFAVYRFLWQKARFTGGVKHAA
jgi:hypothetical protein